MRPPLNAARSGVQREAPACLSWTRSRETHWVTTEGWQAQPGPPSLAQVQPRYSASYFGTLGSCRACSNRRTTALLTRALGDRRPASRSATVPASSRSRTAISPWVRPNRRRTDLSPSGIALRVAVGSIPRKAITSGPWRIEGSYRPSSHPATVSRVTRQRPARVRCDRPRSSRRRRMWSPSVTSEVG